MNAHRYHRASIVTNDSPTQFTPPDLTAVRADDAAREIVRAWRRLAAGGGEAGGGGGVGGGRTLVACSGGADSSAMLLALAAETDNLVVASIRHEMRPRAETEADIGRVRSLAGALGLAFDAADAPGASEGAARRSRYAALAALADRHACPFVAVAHHADDLLETQIMALLRGASLRGLGAMRPRRRLGERVTLIRPLLGVRRVDTERLCGLGGVTPAVDRSNEDVKRLRAALRVGALGEVVPGAAGRAARTASLMRQAQGLVEERAAAVRGRLDSECKEDPHRRAAHDTSPDGIGGGRGLTSRSIQWNRRALGAEPGIVIAEVLRRAFAERTGGRGMDAMTGRTLRPIVRAIRDDSNERREFRLAMGVRVVVEGDAVQMEGGPA